MPGSSPEATTEAAEAVEAQVVDTTAQDASSPAESSPSESKGEKGDILSAVKAALAPKPETPPGSDTQGSDPASADAESAEGDESDDLTEEELARLRPKTRKRIDNLLKDRSARDAKIAEIEPLAEQFTQVKRFVDNAGLSKDEVNLGFDIMRDLKHDPLKAYDKLKPIFQQLQQIAGDVLPNDLQEGVNLGQLTEAHARELALARSRANIATQQNERTNQQTQQERQVNEQRARVTETASAVTAWERSKEGSDPDWKLKQPRVTELIELDVIRQQRANPGYFPTPEQALAMAKTALDKVEKDLKQFAPARREVKAVGDVASNRSAAPKPKTALEAARQGLEALRAG